MDDKNNTKIVALVSLCSAIGGIIIPLILYLIMMVFEMTTKSNMPYMLCFLLFAGLEIVALITGYFSRNVIFGKVGFYISIALIAVSLFFIPTKTEKSYAPSNSPQENTSKSEVDK